MIQRALLSVSDKTNLIHLANALNKYNIKLIATGNTHQTLKKANIPCHSVSEFTGFPEILQGQVKTLHPKIYASILGAKTAPSDQQNHNQTKSIKIESTKIEATEVETIEIEPIEMLIVNLYPFEKKLKEKNTSIEKMKEYIDIGGVSLLRAGAKNFKNVVVLSNPNDYEKILSELNKNKTISQKSRLNLAIKAFEITTHYDKIIAQYLAQQKNKKGIYSKKQMTNSKSYEIINNTQMIPQVVEWLNIFCKEQDIDQESRSFSMIALDEAITNIMLHAYPSTTKAKILVNFQTKQKNLIIRLTDFGAPFKPLNINKKKRLGVDKLKKGGYGLLLIKQFMDKLEFEYDPQKQCNNVIMTKKYNGAKNESKT